MLIIFYFFFIWIHLGYSNHFCAKYINCETSENQSSCPNGTFYRENVKVNGCCPGCVTLKAENQSCWVSADCQPGLGCSSSKKCEKDPLQVCDFYKRYDFILNKTKYWNPTCLSNGTYAPKQCKGEKMAGKCFCVNEIGERIFGEEEWSKAENMTCTCSRLAEKMEKQGMEATLHCDRLGNFEPLQCDQKVCWCANPTTGIPYTVMVPLEMMGLLPCYNRDAFGAQYFKQCDSANHMQKVVKSLLRNHGTTEVTLIPQNCNFDGSYHRVQILREKKRCTFINNSPLTEAIESNNTNCNCAYDRHVAQMRGADFLADCLPNGNYKNRQIWNERVTCIDEDGFHYSNDSNDCTSTA